MKILFIGDSITDADRDRNDPAGLGTGYVSLFAEKLAPLYEDTQFVFVNRGVSGDRIFDIAARLDGCLAEKADIVVLLAGINDVWHKYTDGLNFDPEAFAECYASVAQKIKDSGAKLVIAQPFLLNVPDKKRMRREFDLVLKGVQAAADKYADAYVALDEIFAGVSQSVSVSAYSPDGIHPTHRAARLIADNLIKKIRPFIS
ncbi:MAG TPA: hypothetical protein H9708_01670 [Candidatus Borkfalkia stercoripullorum]|nr:hypothetical protein [Candidatus Borkfalkia stercoripullorum]